VATQGDTLIVDAGAKMSVPRLLVVEDDFSIAREIVAALTDHGLSADHAGTGSEAVEKARTERYDALILDRMLPGTPDGLGALTQIRALGITAPVLILSALSAVDERVRGLRAGGDDYLTKPFEFMELTARIDALLRRSVAGVSSSLAVADLRLNLVTRVAARGERVLDLLPREWRLLEFLVRNEGQVLTRAMIFEEVWGYRFDERTNTIDVHMGNLRRKVDQEPVHLIHTIRATGYVLRAPD
jgi:two-component system OmpR family response regulator